MHMPRQAVLAAVLSSSCLTGVAAQTQQQGTSFDVTHCYVADTIAIESPSAYRALSLHQRGVIRANEAGGQFDNFATRCVGAVASIGAAPLEGRGYCEWAGSGEDRVLIRWTVVAAGRGSGVFIGGTGRYKGISGEISFQQIAPTPTLEPGIVRACLHNTGQFKLP